MRGRNLQQWSSHAKEAWSKSLMVAKFFCFLHVTNTYLFTLALTHGPSMLPTLSLTANLVLADRISPRLRKVSAGDIVLVRSPVNPRKVVAKRVIGMEGDRVTYVVDPRKSDTRDTVVVPKGHIWIEGDNIHDSNDSRKFGSVPYGLLHARVFWRVWPPKDFGSLGPRPE